MSVAPLALTPPNSLTTALRPWLATDGPSGLHAESRYSLLTIARRAQPPTVSSVGNSQASRPGLFTVASSRLPAARFHASQGARRRMRSCSENKQALVAEAVSKLACGSSAIAIRCQNSRGAAADCSRGRKPPVGGQI